MVETLGSQLRHARLGRGLSLEDAAHGTKVRAARLADLENDVYTNFPNIAYARSFLVIYGKFLGVDVSPYLGAFEDTNSFGLDDYQYLSEEPVAQYRAVRRESAARPFRPRRHVRRRLPVRVPALLAICFVLGLGAWHLTLRFRQLGSLEQLAARQASRENPPPAPATAEELGEAPVTPASSWSLAAPAPATAVENAGAQGPELLLASNTPLLPPALPTMITEAPKAPPVVSKQVTVKPLRKTYVTVVVNDPAARPAYEDWVAPGARPLSFRGDKFFVHVRDKGSVEIAKDGVIQPQGGTDLLIE